MAAAMFCMDQSAGDSRGSAIKPAHRIRRSRAHRRQEGDPLFGSQAHAARSVFISSDAGHHGHDDPRRVGYTDMWAG